MRIICVRMYSGVCMCVCMRNGRAGDAARTHNRPDCTESAHSMQSRPYIRVRAQPHRSQASLFFFLHLPPRARENGRAIMYVCVYAEWKSERHCARTHAHTTPHRLAASLFLILLLPSRSRENGRARDTARTYACTASLVLTSSACLGTNCMARSTRRIQDRTHAHTASSERAELRVHCRAGCCDGFGRGPHARTARSEASELRAAG